MVYLIPFTDAVLCLAPSLQQLFLLGVYSRSYVYDAGALILPDAFVFCSLVLLKKFLRLEVSKAPGTSDEEMGPIEMLPWSC